MRRTLAAAVVATEPAPCPALAVDAVVRGRRLGSSRRGRRRRRAPTAAPSAALGSAEAALDGQVAGARRPDATLALRDLFVALPRLGPPSGRTAARSSPGRPTGAATRTATATPSRSKRKCATRICIHWVPTHRATPRPSSRWVTKHPAHDEERLGARRSAGSDYRRPVRDGRRGGNSKFDVYLKDVGAKGLYGYCAPRAHQAPAPAARLGLLRARQRLRAHPVRRQADQEPEGHRRPRVLPRRPVRLRLRARTAG